MSWALYVTLSYLLVKSTCNWPDMSRNAGNKLHGNLIRVKEMSPCFFPQLQHHSCLGIQTIYLTKCPLNSTVLKYIYIAEFTLNTK